MFKEGTKANIFRVTSIFSMVTSLLLNLFMVTFDGVIAVLYQSSWLAIMSVYYLIISFMRISFLFRAGKGLFSKERETASARNYRSTGRLIMVMAIILAFSVYVMTKNMVGHSYPGILIVFVAIYTLFKVIMSFRKIFKAGRISSFTAMSIQMINSLDALVSILVLESAIITEFSSFRNSFSQQFMLWSGLAISFIVFLTGLSSNIQAHRHLNAI